MADHPKQTDSHPHSEKQTNTDTHKATTTFAAIIDPSFPLPSLTETSPTFRYILSFGTLFALLTGGTMFAHLLGLEILQTSQPIVMSVAVSLVAMAAFWFTGTLWIDWFELVIGYWWLSMPMGALAGIAIVLNAEKSATMAETD